VTGSLTEIPHPPGIIYPSSLWTPAWYGVAAGGETYQRAIIEGLKSGESFGAGLLFDGSISEGLKAGG
jgi:hypothetical protein